MQAARRLYELANAQATGTVRLQNAPRAGQRPTAPLHLELHHGWVHAVDLSPAYSLVGDAPARGEDRLRLFLQLLGEEHYTWEGFDAQARPQRLTRGACQPFHPAATVRNYVDQQLAREVGANGAPGRWFRARLGLSRVQLTAPPHASCIGQDERPLLALLTRPRTLAELDATGLCPPERTARLLAFLDAVGALGRSGEPGPSPWAELELPDGAPLDEVKHAFRRLAMELHPDRHPDLSDEDRRALEARFAKVSAAYAKLV